MKSLPTLLSLFIFAIISNPVKGEEMTKSPSEKTVSKKASAEEAKLQKAATFAEELSAKEKTQVLKLLNDGKEQNLIAIKGIASSRAKLIIDARPFSRIEDLVKIRGIGLSTFGSFLEYGKNPSPQTSVSES